MFVSDDMFASELRVIPALSVLRSRPSAPSHPRRVWDSGGCRSSLKISPCVIRRSGTITVIREPCTQGPGGQTDSEEAVREPIEQIDRAPEVEEPHDGKAPGGLLLA